MNNQISASGTTFFSTFKTKTIAALCAIAIAVAFPQLLHLVGALTGLGTALGETVLPMHLAIIMVGLLAGPVAGAVAGAASPLISFALSGMPGEAVLPFMIFELAGYGLAAGLILKSSLNIFLKLLIIQISGRALRAAAVLISFYGLGTGLPPVTIWTGIVAGLFGIVLQWVLIPVITKPIFNSARK